MRVDAKLRAITENGSTNERFRVSRVKDPNGPEIDLSNALNVSLTWMGNATGPGVGSSYDYSAYTGSTQYTTPTIVATIPANKRWVDITVNPEDDAAPEWTYYPEDDTSYPWEEVSLTALPGTEYGLHTHHYDNTKIKDDDAASGPKVTVTAPDDQAVEGVSDSGYFRFTRDATTGSLTVKFTFSGTASFNVDYTLPTTVTFDDGVGTVDSPVTPALDSQTEDPPEKIRLTLQDGAGYRVGDPQAANVFIDDTPPGQPFVSLTYFADDTGTSDTDRVTKDDVPTVGGSATVGSTVTVSHALQGTSAWVEDGLAYP